MNVAIYAVAFVVILSALAMAFMTLLFEIGMLQPRRMSIAIQTQTLSKQYDGTPLVGELFDIVSGGLVSGHDVEIISKSRQTEVGECENRMEFIIRDPSGADVTDMYDITVRFGSLRVVRPKVTIRLASDGKIYDGKPISNNGFSIVGPNGFAANHYAIVYAAPEITNVGTIPNNGTVRVVDDLGNDVTDQYDLEVKDGVLEVSGKPITLRTESAQKKYDGTPLSESDWTLSGGSLNEGHQIRVTCPVTLTEVGRVENTPAYSIFDAAGVDVTDQYAVTVREGVLEVNPMPLYISTGTADKIYDGELLDCDKWEHISGELAAGAAIECIGTAEITEVGMVPNYLKFAVRDGQGKDITDCYDIVQNAGSLTVRPRQISVLTGSISRKFDSTPAKTDTFSLISGSLCPGHTMSVVGESRTEIGRSENVPVSYVIFGRSGSNVTDVTDCYQVVFSYGTITVTP